MGIILVILFLVSGGLFNYMRMQRWLNHKQTENSITHCIAQSLATLALHKIIHEDLNSPGSPLVEKLGVPLSKMSDFSLPVNLEGSLNEVLASLSLPLRDLGTYTWSIKLECRKTDFKAIGLNDAFPREKRGLVHLMIDISYKKLNDTGSGNEDNFHFVAPVKIVAGLIPTLSKFTLYIENAAEGNPWRFNLVSTDENGGLKADSPAKPIVLDNAGDTTIPSTLSELVKKPAGLVFLGGGPVYLNLARGWGPNPEYGEGFHLFAHGKGDGIYPTDWKDHMAILNWDQGTCVPDSDGGEDWFNYVKNSPRAKYAKVNSLFRLMGTDTQPSPTLVLGQVFRGIICARAFKSANEPPPFPPSFLPYIKDTSFWTQCLAADPPEGIPTLKPFFILVPELRELSTVQGQLLRYQETFASDLLTAQPYNIGLAFFATHHDSSSPVEGYFKSGDDIVTLMRSNPPPSADIANAVPAEYHILPGVDSLSNMSAFLNGMQIPGPRAAWTIGNGTTVDIWDELQSRGLLIPGIGSNQSLDLNGWVMVDAKGNLQIDQALSIVSNGGIVLKKGNIIIRKPIKGNGKVFHFVTLDGNIEIRDFYGDVEASLTACKGKVIVGAGTKLTIRGSVAMSCFDLSTASQGANIKYDPQLSAQPGQTADAGSEKSTLCISIEPHPFLVP